MPSRSEWAADDDVVLSICEEESGVMLSFEHPVVAMDVSVSEQVAAELHEWLTAYLAQ